ncbi:hypothetical protein B0T16DRAFT_460182 [Cercophora newfieldiana]|uniref:Uncharacterized protein n=1 Tax=Cercophora newfieldiana TaxID=92897 RepID=A0AA39Y160_9PEZI|nr:hypothetical protein B0T16DRAFT_460182 [Cercophora newfieldiana]
MSGNGENESQENLLPSTSESASGTTSSPSSKHASGTGTTGTKAAGPSKRKVRDPEPFWKKAGKDDKYKFGRDMVNPNPPGLEVYNVWAKADKTAKSSWDGNRYKKSHDGSSKSHSSRHSSGHSTSHKGSSGHSSGRSSRQGSQPPSGAQTPRPYFPPPDSPQYAQGMTADPQEMYTSPAPSTGPPRMNARPQMPAHLVTATRSAQRQDQPIAYTPVTNVVYAQHRRTVAREPYEAGSQGGDGVDGGYDDGGYDDGGYDDGGYDGGYHDGYDDGDGGQNYNIPLPGPPPPPPAGW